MSIENDWSRADFLIVRALEDGVAVCGLSRGEHTKIHHSERLSKDEVMIAQFTEHTAAIKVKGKSRDFDKVWGD